MNTAGKVTLVANGSNAGVSTLSTLTINGAGKLDLNDNDMILPYVSASPLATIKGYLATGYNAGNWNGNGLDSTAANGSAGKQTALGIGEATDLGITSLDGVTITGKAVVVKYTYYGDASLDGKVDLGNDFPLFLEGYLGHGSAGTSGISITTASSTAPTLASTSTDSSRKAAHSATSIRRSSLPRCSAAIRRHRSSQSSPNRPVSRSSR